MSIPKEPRQLMINLMYLVLTAMLALNVSAKIINAFFRIDDGVQANSTITDDSNTFTFTALDKNADQDREKYQPLVDAARDVQDVSEEFADYIETLRDTLAMASGGYYPEDDKNHPGQPKGYKNKDVTTRLLVNEGLATELKNRILDARQRLVDIVNQLNGAEGTNINDETLSDLERQISLTISDAYKTETMPGKKDSVTWEYFTFNQMPLAAVFPLLSQYSNDMKSSEAAVLNFLVDQLGKEAIKVDNFIPISAPKKSYVIAGESFETEISVGAASSSINENVRIQVNGQSLPVEEGKANYAVRTSSTGVKQYTVDITLTNPTTGNEETYSSTFEYEVGRRSATVSADKMNVLYIGVDNPLSVSAAGVSSNALRVSGTGGGIKLARTGEGKYNATVSSVGTARITVSGGGLAPTTFDFRTKRIPDPVARVAGESGGTLANGVFRAQRGVFAELDNFDFDARCTIAGFTLIYQPPREDLQEVINAGQAFTGSAKNLINQARPGDTYYFNNVRALCPGDGSPRKINPMVFKIR